ncbi:uncharacterized protein PFL1_00676 [Pseudozyma flocculosa PF-1]|uniref:uncharacterized protein n=1 Tax=Pseudozyma flocculosa PF-1 TaxID=1277687 RepID=UPI000456089D|nr:uncharacterized protein PFL1_00676 [Pseudozyma flocculosa PF-1]EPQ32482.1 hypothetical protein PFL1_00676 [Pseudozyma flocculosa PF-1]
MPPGYDPIRDMGTAASDSASPPPLPPPSLPLRRPSHHDQAPPYHARVYSGEDPSHPIRDAPNGGAGGARMRADVERSAYVYSAPEEARFHPDREESGMDRQHAHYAQQPAVQRPARASPLHHHHPPHQQHHLQQQLQEQQQQQYDSQQHLQHASYSHPSHHPQLLHRSSSSSSRSSLPHGDLHQQQRQSHEGRRSASIHDLITASEIQAAAAAASAASAAAAGGPGHAGSPLSRGVPPSRSLSHQGEDYQPHDPYHPSQRPGSSMSRSTSNSSQPTLTQRTSSQSQQLYPGPPPRTERSPSMANLLNDGTAGAVKDRPRSGSQSSISSMLSHSHSHPQLPSSAQSATHQQHAPPSHHHHGPAASAPPAPPSAYSHSLPGHDPSGRDSMAMHSQSRPSSSTSASWAQSPVMNAPLTSASSRTNSSPAMGPAQLGLGGSGSDRTRILSHPGLMAGGGHPRSLSASYGHGPSLSVTSSPSGPMPPALHPSPSHRFAVPDLPAHRSPENRRIPLPPSPSSGPMIPGRGPTTPGAVWPSTSGPGQMGGSYAGYEEVHAHSSMAAHLASSPRRSSVVHPTLTRFQQPPTPGAGAGIPQTPGSLPPTPGNFPPTTPGSRSIPAMTPSFDPRYGEEYFPKRHSDASESYAGHGAGRSVVHPSPVGLSQHGDGPAHPSLDRRMSSASARRPSHEMAPHPRESPASAHAASPLLGADRRFAGPPPLPPAAGSPTSESAAQARRSPFVQPEPSPRGAMFDPVRGITAVPASRRTSSSSSSRHDEPSPMQDPRRFSESSIGARSAVSDASSSAAARRTSMDVLGPIMASPPRSEAIGKRRSSNIEEGVRGDGGRDGKKARLDAVDDKSSMDHPNVRDQDRSMEAASPDRDGYSPRAVRDQQPEAMADEDEQTENQAEEEPAPAKVAPVLPEPHLKPKPKPSSPPSADARDVDESGTDAEMAIDRKPSPPRFTPPAEEDQAKKNGRHAAQDREELSDREAREQQRTPPPIVPASARPASLPQRPVSPAAAAPASAAAAAPTPGGPARPSRAPMPRYAPKHRVSAPTLVMRPIGIDEIDDKRRRCRNPLREEWERHHRADSREPLDNLLREYYESKQAQGSGRDAETEAALKRARDDDLKDALEVADHYNKRREVGIQGREESPIIALRRFNNWVKSVLIGRFSRGDDPRLDGRGRPRGGRMMELGCGKGGDLKKWDKVNPASLVGVDIAQVSIEQAIQRHRDNKSRFEARFFAFDCFSRPLTEVVPRELLEPGIDTVSLQFCMHYAWESVEKARTMLDNVSRFLRVGGTFIGTIPDCDVLRNRLYRSGATSRTFGNAHYHLTFDERLANTPFGDRYTFFLEDAVENVPEYVVDWPTFLALADEVGLRCVYSHNFADIYNQDGRGGRRNGTEFGSLAERMRVVDAARGELVMDEDMWEAVTLYKGFAFEKVR